MTHSLAVLRTLVHFPFCGTRQVTPRICQYNWYFSHSASHSHNFLIPLCCCLFSCVLHHCLGFLALVELLALAVINMLQNLWIKEKIKLKMFTEWLKLNIQVKCLMASYTEHTNPEDIGLKARLSQLAWVSQKSTQP